MNNIVLFRDTICVENILWNHISMFGSQYDSDKYDEKYINKVIDEFIDFIDPTKVVSNIVLSIPVLKKIISLKSHSSRNSFWNSVVKTQKLDTDFVEEYAEYLGDKKAILTHQLNNLDESYIAKHMSTLDQQWMIKHRKFTENFILNNFNYKKFMRDIVDTQDLSEDFIKTHVKEDNHIKVICEKQEFSREMLDYIVENHPECIEKYAYHNKLEQDFINNHYALIRFSTLETKQTLCDEFIRKHSASLDWTNLALNQKLSLDILDEFAHIVRWDILLCVNKDYPEELIAKHEKYIKRFLHLGIHIW